jgi:hypothetical protein
MLFVGISRIYTFFMSWGYARAMKAKLFGLGVLVGSMAFAAAPPKAPNLKFSIPALERCPKAVKGEWMTLERKNFSLNPRVLFRGPAQIQPIPPARPLESKICPIPLAK